MQQAVSFFESVRFTKLSFTYPELANKLAAGGFSAAGEYSEPSVWRSHVSR